MSTVGMTPDERKLQPSYEDVSAGRYKAADSAVTRHLKKNPKSQAALTLRFVLHERQHSPESICLKAFKDAKHSGDLNPRSLWWMTMSLRNLRRLDLCVELYQDMWAKYPSSMEIGEQVFLHASACWDTKVMAESSRKVFNGIKDATWARLAAWADWANRSPQPTSSTAFPPPAAEGTLKIASILLATAGPSVPTSDILWLKLQVLLSSGQNRKAHELLMEHGHGGGLARDWYRMKGVEEIAKRERESGQDAIWVWEQELGQFLQEWKNDEMARRNYAYYQHSILVAEALMETKIELVRALLDALVELDGHIGEKERAPRLARLELDLMLKRESSELAMEEDDWKVLVVEYLSRWGSKGSVVPELEGIVGDKKDWLQGELEKRIAAGQDDERSYRAVVNAHIYLLRQKPTTWQTTEEDIKLYWQLYLDGLTYGRNLPRTDVQPADEIGLATVQLILSTSAPQAPLRAIICLESILSQSPSCARAKFLLVRLYRRIGALSLVAPLLQDLKPSESQLDTLLHIWVEGGATDALLAPSPKGQASSAWDEWTFAMERMYSRTATDSPEYVKQALENGSFSKIHSIRSLASTLAHSRTRANMIIEVTRYRLVKHTDRQEWSSPLLKEVAGWEHGLVQDSRNWELMPSIGGNRTSVAELTRIDVGAGEPTGKARILNNLVGGSDMSACKESGLLDGMSHSDKSFYSALHRISARTGGAEGSEPLADIFDDFKTLPQSPASRWETLNHAVHIVELASILDTISKSLTTGSVTKSKTKPQESQSSGKISFRELTSAKSGLKGHIKSIVGSLNGLMMDDRELDWVKLNGGLVDADLVATVGKGVVKARVEALERSKSLLEAL